MGKIFKTYSRKRSKKSNANSKENKRIGRRSIENYLTVN